MVLVKFNVFKINITKIKVVCCFTVVFLIFNFFFKILNYNQYDQLKYDTDLSNFKAQNKYINNESLLSFEIFSTELKQFKESLLNVGLFIDYCPLVPKNVVGYLNTSLLLDKGNLSSIVEFYDSKKAQDIYKFLKALNKSIYFGDLFYFNNYSTGSNSAIFEDLLWSTNNMSLINMTNIYWGEDENPVELGGYWKPKGCISRFKIAIIIPYKNRLPYLKVLLYFLHTILQRQMLDYRIYVVEPDNDISIPFNKGSLYNSGFLTAMSDDPEINCIILHDVDLLPENDTIMYTCNKYPKHLSVAIDKFDYILPYKNLVGGVLAIKPEDYQLINGYSNMFWGWGGEGIKLNFTN